MKIRHLTPLSLLALSGLAFAGTVVTVQYLGEPYHETVAIYRDGAYHGSFYAGQMSLSVGGSPQAAFCIDLDHTVSSSWSAEIVEVPAEDPWCELAWIIDNYPVTSNHTSAVKQTAIWKLYYDEVWGEDVTVTPATTDADAEALLADSAGHCLVTSCTAPIFTEVTVDGASDGLVYASLYVEQDGAPLAGVEATATITGGTLLDPADGVAHTDEDGFATVVIDLDGATSTSVDFAFSGQSIFALVPTTPSQQLLTFTSETCDFEDGGSYAVTPLGNPETIGFWKHQAKIAYTGTGGHPHVDAAVLESWLPMTVLGNTVADLGDMYGTLWLSKATMQQRAQQQCLATMLNMAYGELGWFSAMDPDGDGVDSLFWELWSEAEADYAAGDYEAAKDICDGINNL
ncbi:MAG: hypothetical protein ABIO70_01090 [Pseudomonadota bacterium]